MNTAKTTFALFFGNRGFFPGEVIADARKEMIEALEKNGYGYIIMDESLTRYGAVETITEGAAYNKFLKDNEGKYDGIILCLPNFGDENGASVAFKGINVPILVQAYPDEIGKMDFAHRRDALCGKIAMCNVLRQCNIRYSLTKDATVFPLSDAFTEDLRNFAAVCRIVKELRTFNIGAIGARTTAFKTVRIDEIAMQSHGVNVETIDLSMVFDMMDKVEENELKAKMEHVAKVADFGNYPPEKLENLSRFAVTVDKLIEMYNLQAVAIRCWDELEKKYNIAPCVILSDLNERGIPAACELDVNNAIMMYALQCASQHPVMLLDLNNNYGEDKTKSIMFHCSAIPGSFFCGGTCISEHLMFKKTYGEGTGVGIVNGKVKSCDVTIGSFKTEDGELWSFSTEGKLTDDAFDKEFFGCGIVYESPKMPDVVRYMFENGYRHHVAITPGSWSEAVEEAFEIYLDYNCDII